MLRSAGADTLPDCRVLIVDDDRDYGESLGDLLELHGCVIAHALSGEAALSAIGSRAFDVVLLDMRMPGKSGIPLLREMLAIVPELAVIVVTGFVNIGMEESVMRAGACAVLIKPVQLAVLVSTIRRCWQRQRPSS